MNRYYCVRWGEHDRTQSAEGPIQAALKAYSMAVPEMEYKDLGTRKSDALRIYREVGGWKKMPTDTTVYP
jgi:hypothetical protein